MYGTFNHTARLARARRQNQSRYRQALEALEHRQLMDADLLPAWVSWGPSFDSNVQGDPITATATIRILNVNHPSTAVPAGKTIDVKVFARPQGASDNSQDILVNKSVTKVNVSNLQPNSEKVVGVPVVLTNLPQGDYIFVAQVDTTNVVAESDETNNYTTGNVFDFSISERPTDLFLQIDPSNPFYTKPFITDGVSKATIKVRVRNFDTVATAANQMATFTVVAHRTTDDQEFTLPALAPIKIGAIGPGKNKTITLTETMPLGMETGNYVFKVTMTTDIPSDGTSNNTAQTYGFNASRGFVDLVTNITSATIPPSYVAGVTKNGTLKVDLTNDGNVALPTTQHVDVKAFLHPANATDNSQDIQVGQVLNYNIAKLKPNSGPGHPKKAVSIPLSINSTINADDFVYVVTATPVESLSEELVTNNSDSGLALSIQTAQADLSFVSVPGVFLADSSGGDTGTATVTIKNNSGNVTALGNVTISYYVSTGSVIDGSATAIGHTTLSNFNLAAGKTSAPIKVALTLPNPTNTTEYNILAQITIDGVVTDTDTSNNSTGILASTTTTHATSLWGDVVHPTVIKFGPNTLGDFGPHQGNMYDTSGNLIGTYYMVVPGAIPHVPHSTNSLSLTFTGFSPLGSLPVWNNINQEAFFTGKTVTFSLSPTGAKGSIEVDGHTVYFKY